jgi:hypothetical protein
MKSFRQLLSETLSKRQRKWVDNRSSPWSMRIHNDLFNNIPEGGRKIDNDTIALPLGDVDRSRENEIRGHIEPHGYQIHDYVNGIAVDKYGRQTKIAKILGKLKVDPNLHASDPRVIAKNADQVSPDTHEMVISRHPYHVAGMSSGRHWRSCMTLPGDETHPNSGEYHHKVAGDLDNGTLIAYLTKKGVAKPATELNKNEAIARVLFKKFESPDRSHIFRPERRSYSAPKPGGYSEGNQYPLFDNAAKEFAHKQWPTHPDKIYFKNDKLYNDDGVSTFASVEDMKDYSPEQMHQYAQHVTHLKDQYADDYVKDPEHIHGHYMHILNHPNVSPKTLKYILDNNDDKQQYGWNPGVGDEDFHSELISKIATHPKVDPDTLEDILDNHDVSQHIEDIYDNLLNNPKTSSHLLKRIHDDDPEGYADRILEHPNIDHEVLSDIYDYNHRQHTRYGPISWSDHLDKILAVAKHKKTDAGKHDEMIQHIENGDYDNDLYTKKELLNGIAKNTQDRHLLHNIAVEADNHPEPEDEDHKNNHLENYHTILKNKNTESPTIQYIHDKLDKTNPEHLKVLKTLTTHPNTSLAILNQLRDEKHPGISTLADLRVKKQKVNRIL